MGNALLLAGGNNTVVTNGQFGHLSSALGKNATEARQSFTTRLGGTLSKLAVRQDTAGTVASTRLRKNVGNGNQLVSQTDNTAGVFTDAVNTDALVSGDAFCVQLNCTNTPTLSFVRAVFAATADHACLYSNAGTANAGGVVSYLPFAGGSNSSSTEADVKVRLRAGGTARNYQAYVNTNTYTLTVTVQARINGADGAGSIPIGAGLTGLFEDSANTDTLAAGADFNFAVNSSGGSGVCALVRVGCAITIAGSAVNDLVAAGSAATRTASATPNFYAIGGGLTASTTEVDRQTQHGFVGSMARARVYVSANTYAADATLTSRVNGSPGAQSATITAGVTGIFEDTVNADAFAATDDICLQVVGGTSGSITTPWFAVTETDTTVSFATYLLHPQASL